MRITSLLTLALIAALALPSVAVAQQRDEPAPPDPQPAPDDEATDAPDDEGDDDATEEDAAAPAPSLDDLLGLPSEDKPDDAEADQNVEDFDPMRAELDRALSGEDISEMFQEAVRQMGDAANLLDRAGDAGVRTQRLQEEILRKLDILIEQAEQQQQSSSSSSSQSQQQQQQQQQQAQQQRNQQSQANERSGDSQEQTPPGGEEGNLPEALDAARAAWGALPQRVRDALLEGAGERFSSMYQRLTEEYYRRLAEEGREP